MEKWNDMVLARTEAAKTVAFDEKVGLFFHQRNGGGAEGKQKIVATRNSKYEGVLSVD